MTTEPKHGLQEAHTTRRYLKDSVKTQACRRPCCSYNDWLLELALGIRRSKIPRDVGFKRTTGVFSTPSTREPSSQVLYASSLACPGMPFLPGIREPSQQEDCGEIRHQVPSMSGSYIEIQGHSTCHLCTREASQSVTHHTDEWPNPSVIRVVQAKE